MRNRNARYYHPEDTYYVQDDYHEDYSQERPYYSSQNKIVFVCMDGEVQTDTLIEFLANQGIMAEKVQDYNDVNYTPSQVCVITDTDNISYIARKHSEIEYAKMCIISPQGKPSNPDISMVNSLITSIRATLPAVLEYLNQNLNR